MKKISKNPLFRPTGLNSSFHGAGGSFQDYTALVSNIIQLGRADLNDENRNQIVNANSPYEYRPAKTTKKGILLIHGLYDSPYSLRPIGKFFQNNNFLVRSILLPGNGTIPGDLTHIKYQEWIKATEYGVKSFSKQVNELYLLGFSLGGTLAIHAALNHPNLITKLILLAPALKPRRKEASFLIRLYQLISHFNAKFLWYQTVKQTSFARYECYPVNAAFQASLLMKKTQQFSRDKTLAMPIFMVLSSDDESIDVDTDINFFLKQNNPKNQLLIYTSNGQRKEHPQIIYRNSTFPNERILDLSHTSLVSPPEDLHYGKEGQFKDFQHYGYDLTKHPGEVYFGSILKKNLKKYVVQRLSFNPDFTGMLDFLNKFISTN